MSPVELSGAALIGWAALGGGLGAALRYLVDAAVNSRWRHPFPLATFLINVTGSLALGLVIGFGSAGAEAGASATVIALVGTGVLGGYTTFSTASYGAVHLVRSGRRGLALTYAMGTMFATVAAALVGLWLGGR